jgi:transposase
VRLSLLVRKFFCDNPLCARCIFAERFSRLTIPYARRTLRLDERLTQMGCESGGEAAARMAQTQRLGRWSPDVILRLIRHWLDPLAQTPRVLGVDDWAKRKGQTYGTILCDLEQHRVIELLADREATTLSQWLKAHPGVEIVCRDRASAYADGVRTGAPNAIQIADRFHLVVNLGGVIKRIVDRHHDHLKVIAEEAVPPAPATSPTSLPNPVRPYTGRLSPSPRLPSTMRLHQETRRQIRTARWQEICRLKAEGLTQRAICRQLHATRKTVRRALKAEGHPPANGNTLKTLEPFVDFLTRRWHAGQHNARQLHRELAAQGHLVSYHAIMYFVAPLRMAARQSQLAIPSVDIPADPVPSSTPSMLESEMGLPSIPLHQVPLRLSGRLVSRLLMGNISSTSQQQSHLDQLCTALPELALTRQLATSFRAILNQRLPDQLDPWLQLATACSLPEFHAFADSLARDKAAVIMAFTSDWSSGQVEGQVNRLKLIKRSMYGRGKLDLLRKRVLYKHMSAPLI